MSCKQTRPEIDKPLDFLAGDDQQSHFNPKFSSIYSLEGVPRDKYRENNLIISLSHDNLQSLAYIFGTPECEGVYNFHNPDENLELDLKNFHGIVRLCYTGIDVQDEDEGLVHVHKWIQGYPEIINRMFISDCMPVDSPDVSIKLTVKLTQDHAGDEIDPDFAYEVYADKQCNGAILQNVPLDTEEVAIQNSILSFTIGEDKWSLQMFFDDVNNEVAYFNTIEADGSEGVLFTYAEE